MTESSRAGSKTRTALRQLGIRRATDLLKAFPPDCLDSGHGLASRAAWQKYLTEIAGGGLDQAQLRTIVRVLDNEPSLAAVWNWQERGVRRCVQQAPDLFAVPAQPAGVG